MEEAQTPNIKATIGSNLYEKMNIFDYDIPVIFHKDVLSPVEGPKSFALHWHEKIELLFFLTGEAVIRCHSEDFLAKAGDLVVINSNELHQGFCSGIRAEYYCIIFDAALLQSRRADACEEKYIGPIAQNRILFSNLVKSDPVVKSHIERLVREYSSRQLGYEIAVKAAIYELLLYLLRHHAKKMISSSEYEAQARNLNRFKGILEYIEEHYNERISIDGLSEMAGISRYYFCRLFKSITGNTLTAYLNGLRVNKAEEMLKSGAANVTEAALACGFDDLNYFSRIYKKYKSIAPSSVRENA